MAKREAMTAKETVGIFSPLFVTNKLTAVAALEEEEPLHSVMSQRAGFQKCVRFGASERAADTRDGTSCPSCHWGVASSSH